MSALDQALSNPSQIGLCLWYVGQFEIGGGRKEISISKWVWSAIVQRGDVQWSVVGACPSSPRRAGRRWHTHPAALILQSALQIQTPPIIAQIVLIPLIKLIALIAPCKFKHYHHDENFNRWLSHKVHHWELSNDSNIPTQYFSFTVQYNIYISNWTTYFHCFDFDRELIFSHIRSQCNVYLDKKKIMTWPRK